MKQTKHVLSIFLCLLMLFSCMVPAFAVDETQVAHTLILPQGELDVAVPEELDPSINWDGLAAEIHRLLYTSVTNVDISYLKIPYEQAYTDVITAFISDEPTTLRPKDISFWIDEIDGKTVFSALLYSGDWQNNLARYNACLDAMNQIMYGIADDSSLSQLEKCLLVHDRLAAWTEYDYANLQAGTVPNDSYNAYGILVNRVGVCNGYAHAYMWMLDLMGFQSFYSRSKVKNHGWAKVILDGEPYYVDVTHDDPVWDVPGRVMHKNFMVSLEHYKTTSSNHNGTDYDTSAVSTLYDDSFDKASESEIVYLNGKFWYIDDADKQLKSCSSGGANVQSYGKVGGWMPAGEYTRYTYPKMTAIGDTILYTYDREIRAFNTLTQQTTTVYTAPASLLDSDDYYIAGLQQIDGKVYIYTNNGYNFADGTVKTTHVDSFDFCTHTDKAVLEKTVGPDCKTAGDLKEICADCRAMFETPGGGDKGDHNYQATDTTAATCTAQGYTTYTCTACGDSYNADYTAMLPHDWEWVTDTPATCGTAGSKHEKCKNCTATQSLNTVIPATGSHSYTAQTVKADALKSAATCTAPATYYYSCTTCGKVENNAGHTFTSGSPAAHSYIAQTVKADALKSAATCTSAAVYYYSCVNCGKVEKNDSHTFMSGSATEHVWEWVIDKNATCVAAGSKHEKCKTCTATQSLNTVIPATGSHSYTAQTVKADALKSAATCTAPATYYYSCTTCGAIEKNAGHTFTSGSATAHVDANGDNRCDNCNKDLSEPQPEPQNLCKYCHKEHTGFFGKIVQFFHNILYSLTHLFKK